MPTGRPTKMTPEVIQKLEDAFIWGCTDLEACSYADIAPSTLYAYQEKNEGFSERKDTLKNNVKMRAKRVISDSIDQDDLASAHKVIDRAEGRRLKVGGDEDNPLKTVQEIQYVIVRDSKD